MTELRANINESSPLELRIMQFKSDQAKMQDVNEFLSDLFEKAQREAELRQGIRTKSKIVSIVRFIYLNAINIYK